MSIHLLFQSLLGSVNDTVYITDIQEDRPTLKQCYCVWVDQNFLTIILKNEVIKHTIKWDLKGNVVTYNDATTGSDLMPEVLRILQLVSNDLVAGRARAYKETKEGVLCE